MTRRTASGRRGNRKPGRLSRSLAHFRSRFPRLLRTDFWTTSRSRGLWTSLFGSRRASQSRSADAAVAPKRRASSAAKKTSRADRPSRRYRKPESLRMETLEARQLLSINFTGSYAENFDTLPQPGGNLDWTNGSTIAGWSLFDSDEAPITDIGATNGGGATLPGKFYSFGALGINPFEERALGGVGSNAPYFGSPAEGEVAGWIAVSLTNDTGSTIESLNIDYDGEQWRKSGEAAAQTMTLEYGFGSTFADVSTWTAPGGDFDFTSPINTAAPAPLDGNAAVNRVANRGGELSSLNWSDGDTLWVRWVETNDTGADHGLAIDNVEFSADPVSSTLQQLIDQANPGDTILVAPGTYSGIVIDKNLTLDAQGGAVVFEGGSPALTVTNGQVIVQNGVTFNQAGSDETIRVESGGSLTLIDSVVNESSTAASVAILVQSGGVLDLSSDDNTLNVIGTGSLIDWQDSAGIEIVGNTLTQDGAAFSDNFAIEDAITHALDFSGRGLVTFVDNELFVTDSTLGIQAAVNAADSGDTVNVGAGTYSESLSIGKDVSIAGQGDDVVSVDAGLSFTGIDVLSGFNVEISGIELSNFTSNGVHVLGNLDLIASTILGGFVGVWVDGGTLNMLSTIVSGAMIFGVQADGDTTITDSEISGAPSSAAAAIASSGNLDISGSILTGSQRGLLVSASTASASVHDSDLSGNAVRGLENATAILVDASGNYWGVTDEDDVEDQTLGLVDFTPYLNNDESIPNQSVRGFQADKSHVHVTALGQQFDGGGRVLEGVDQIADGSETGVNRLVDVHSGSYVEDSQIVIDKDLTITGEVATKPVITPGQNFTGANAGDAWLLVDAGITFNLNSVVLDGDGSLVWQALRSHGNTTIDSVDFRDIQGSPNGSPYRGIAIQSFGGTVGGGGGADSHGSGGSASHLIVQNSTFEQIGRVGVLVKGDGATADVINNIYTGKGDGDWLDYAFEAGAGAVIDVISNTISGNRGVASSDGSTSAGVLVTTFWGAGTEAHLSGANNFSSNFEGVHVGFGATDSSLVTVVGGTFANNTGSGIFAGGDSAVVEIDNATITGNGTGVSAILGAEVSIENSDLSGNQTGIFVGSGAEATIENNTSSINDNDIGIDVDGGSATITNNDIHDNDIGVRLNDANVTINTTDIYDNGTGVRVEGTSTLVMNDGTVNDNTGNGLLVLGDGTLQSITVTGTSFSSNSTGQPVSAGFGDITLFEFAGPAGTPSIASFTNVTINSDDPDYAIQVRGRNGDIVNDLLGLNPGSTATVSFNNVDILGNQERFGMLIQQYADLSGFSFNDVVFDSIAQGGLVIFDAAGDLDLGNTTFHDSYTAGDGVGDGTGFDIATSLNNIDATGVTFLDSSDVALDKTDLQDNFAIEDRVGHAVDASATPLVAGFVDWIASGVGTYDDAVFLTTESFAPAAGSTAASVQRAIDVADVVLSKDHVYIKTGTYTDDAQVVIDNDVTVIGEGTGATILTPGFDTGASGNARGWWLVQSGINLDISQLKFDGLGDGTRLVSQAIRMLGTGTIDTVAFEDIDYQTVGVDGGPYEGRAVSTDGAGHLTVKNSTFDRIGRIGVLFFGAGRTGTFENNFYTGKGVGDHLDYGVEVGGGAKVDIIDSTISGNLGVASDGSTSAGVLVTTFFGPGSEAHLSGVNVITGNTTGVAIGFDASDSSDVTVDGGSFSNNDGDGISIFGGSSASLKVQNATVTGNDGAGIAASGDDSIVVAGPAVFIENTDLTGNQVGIYVEDDAIVDAGSVALDGNPTGMGNSAGGNILTGYTGVGGNYAIENQNLDAEGDVDVFARNNNFGSAVPSAIESVVFHTADVAANTEVFFTPAIGSPAPGIVYVNDDWAGTGLGADPDAGYANGNAFGTDAFASIQDAIDAVGAGAIIYVLNGTYDEAVVVDKDHLTIEHLDTVAEPIDPNAATEAYVTRTSGSNGVVIEITATGVTIDGFHVIINRPNSTVGIGASNAASATFTGGAFDGLTIKNNTITTLGDGGTVTSPFLSTTVAGIALLGNGGTIEGVTIDGNTVNLTTSGAGFQRRAVWLREVQADVTDNDLTGVANDLIVQFASSQDGVTATAIDNNRFYSGGVDLTENNSTGEIELTNNQFLITTPSSAQSLVLKNIDAAPVLVQGNTFSGHAIGISMGTSSGVTIDDNDFTPGAFANTVDIVLDTHNFTGGTPAAPFNPVTATITNNEFFGLAGADNHTALSFFNRNPGAASPDYGTVTIGGAGDENTFHGDLDTYIYLDPGTLGGIPVGFDFDASQNLFEVASGTPGTYAPAGMSLEQLFELEDKIVHAVDVGTLGFVTVVAGQVFVTQDSFFGPFTTAPSIQRGIDAADAGDTVYVEAGTYSENLTIGKDINLIGEAGSTILQPAVAGDLVTIDGSGFGDDETVSIDGFNFNGLAGLADRGIIVNNTADFAKLIVNGGDFTGFDFNAIIVLGNATTGLSVADVELSNLTFSNNGLAGGDGSGDIQLFEYNGDASFTNLTLVGSSVGAAGARSGIQLRGVGAASGVGVLSSGAVSFDNVDISGDYVTQMIGIQRYTDVSGFSFTDVKLGGAGSSISGTFGAALRFDAVGDLTTKNTVGEKTIDLGNTYFRGLDSYSPVFDIEFAPDNTWAWVRADGTGTRWNTTIGAGVDVPAGSLSTAQAYEVEDRILHFVEPDHPGHLQPFKGFVEIKDGQAFITDTYASVIDRAIDVVDAGGTVHIADGTYTQSVDATTKAVTLSLGSSPGLVTINGNVTLDGNDTLLMEIDGLTPGTQHDQLVVNGTVTLDGATLNAPIGYSPTADDTIVLIDATTLVGTFGNYPIDGDVVPTGFRIDYDGPNAGEVSLVQNSPPVADAGGDGMTSTYTIMEGNGAAFDGSGSFDPDAFLGDSITYAWDLDDDGMFDDSFVVMPTFTWAQLAAFGITGPGTYDIQLQVTDEFGEMSIDTAILVVQDDTFRVTSFVTNASGFDVTFNRSPNLGDLNLYDGVDAPVELPDLSVVGTSVGTVSGSIVWNALTNTLSWVKTGGILVADTYNITLVSAADAFHDLFGELLDGDGDLDDSEANDDYLDSFVVTASAGRVVSVKDFARGSGQHVDDNPAVALSRLAVSISNPGMLRSIDFNFRYDPALLNVAGASLVPGLPADWQIVFSGGGNSGVLHVVAFGVTPLSGAGNTPIVLIDASVPNAAPYGATEVLRITDLVLGVDDGMGTVVPPVDAPIADYAIHKNAYLGDADGDGIYSGFDASYIARTATPMPLDTGYDAHDWTDPLIVGDVDGNGAIQGIDASIVAQKSVLLPTPQIPNLPGIVLTHVAGGIDPELSIPDAIQINLCDVVVPVSIDIESGAEVRAATFDVTFDQSVLDLHGVTHGAFWTSGSGWSLSFNSIAPNMIRVTLFNLNASAEGSGVIANLRFHVSGTAAIGTYGISAESITPTLGTFTWTSDPGSVEIDTDPPFQPGDFDGDGDVDGADFVIWQTNFPTSSGATAADGDADCDGDVDGADFVVWQTNFPTSPAPAVVTAEASSEGETVGLTMDAGFDTLPSLALGVDSESTASDNLAGSVDLVTNWQPPADLLASSVVTHLPVSSVVTPSSVEILTVAVPAIESRQIFTSPAPVAFSADSVLDGDEPGIGGFDEAPGSQSFVGLFAGWDQAGEGTAQSGIEGYRLSANALRGPRISAELIDELYGDSSLDPAEETWDELADAICEDGNADAEDLFADLFGAVLEV